MFKSGKSRVTVSNVSAGGDIRVTTGEGESEVDIRIDGVDILAMRKLQQDLKDAAGPLAINIDEMPPGSKMSKLMIANRLLIAERDKNLHRAIDAENRCKLMQSGHFDIAAIDEAIRARAEHEDELELKVEELEEEIEDLKEQIRLLREDKR